MTKQASVFSRLVLMTTAVVTLATPARGDIYAWVTPRGSRAFSNLSPPPGVSARLYEEARGEAKNDPFAYLEKQELPAKRLETWKPACSDDYSGLIGALEQRSHDIGFHGSLLIGPHVANGKPLPERYTVPYKVFDTVAYRRAALAYPGSMSCPRRPPLGRFAIESTSDKLTSECEDFRGAVRILRAALDRDRPVAAMYQNLAAHFTRVAEAGYLAADPARPNLRKAGVVLAPWIVETHIAKLDELAAEIEDFIEELTVALEEVREAAIARHCW